MEMKEVQSSQIHSIGHDPETNTLAVRFWSGAPGGRVPGNLYHYPDFTTEQFKAFSECESKGKYFGAHIKGNKKHPHRKINEEKP